MPDKKYQVANPNGIPEGVRILVTESGEFYEGDAIELTDVKDKADFEDLLKQGYVAEVKAKRAAKETVEVMEPEVTDAG